MADFNATRVIDSLINNPILATETVSESFSTEGGAFGAFGVFIIFMLLLVIIFGAMVGGVYYIFFWNKR